MNKLDKVQTNLTNFDRIQKRKHFLDKLDVELKSGQPSAPVTRGPSGDRTIGGDSPSKSWLDMINKVSKRRGLATDSKKRPEGERFREPLKPPVHRRDDDDIKDLHDRFRERELKNADIFNRNGKKLMQKLQNESRSKQMKINQAIDQFLEDHKSDIT